MLSLGYVTIIPAKSNEEHPKTNIDKYVNKVPRKEPQSLSTRRNDSSATTGSINVDFTPKRFNYNIRSSIKKVIEYATK